MFPFRKKKASTVEEFISMVEREGKKVQAINIDTCYNDHIHFYTPPFVGPTHISFMVVVTVVTTGRRISYTEILGNKIPMENPDAQRKAAGQTKLTGERIFGQISSALPDIRTYLYLESEDVSRSDRSEILRKAEVDASTC